MDIMDLLDELEAELSDKKGGLFGKKVDLDKCYNLVVKIKTNLAATLRESEYIMENKRKILENADIVAKNTIREAEERAEHMIDNSEIIRMAELESKRLIYAVRRSRSSHKRSFGRNFQRHRAVPPVHAEYDKEQQGRAERRSHSEKEKLVLHGDTICLIK